MLGIYLNFFSLASIASNKYNYPRQGEMDVDRAFNEMRCACQLSSCLFMNYIHTCSNFFFAPLFWKRAMCTCVSVWHLPSSRSLPESERSAHHCAYAQNVIILQFITHIVSVYGAKLHFVCRQMLALAPFRVMVAVVAAAANRAVGLCYWWYARNVNRKHCASSL